MSKLSNFFIFLARRKLICIFLNMNWCWRKELDDEINCKSGYSIFFFQIVFVHKF